MTGNEIRKAFLDYFAERGHAQVASGSLVPQGDATLMFANAGMVPFKRVFTGEEKRPYTRATTAQKCMRVSGKHNDLEEVGRSPSHQTFFEMLGNFSFGDYFKKEAIEFAWDLLTRVYKLDPNDLVVSVHREDTEAYALWRDGIGLDPKRIFKLGDDENFWAMGDTGPCGPCSEIHKITDRARFEAGGDPSGPGFVEIWNLVFMQFEQRADGTRVPLPKPSIDTGMGLERLTRMLQGVDSNYDTDLFRPLLARASRAREGPLRTRAPTATSRCASRPTTRAPARSSSATACCRRTRAAATCCAACCAARRATACCSGSRAVPLRGREHRDRRDGRGLSRPRQAARVRRRHDQEGRGALRQDARPRAGAARRGDRRGEARQAVAASRATSCSSSTTRSASRPT